ncbi:MAG: C25 family cysteine peptidase [Lentimicrobiaceae bacterium]|nr:C25 family cysteine peptidase [Lentimicrobiaceae bacterium]
MKKLCTLVATNKRKLVAVIALMITLHSGFQLMAQYAIDFGKSSSNTIRLVEDNTNTFKTSLQYAGIKTFGVDAGEKGLFNELIIEDAFSIGEIGEPNLPATKKLIEIPFGADVHVKVLNYTVNEYKLSDYGIENRIMPVQPSVRKDQAPEDIVFEYNQEIYQRDAFISHELASVEVLGVLRGYRLARLTIAPVSYNPVKGIIRVYNDLEVEVSFSNVDESLTEYVKASTFSPYFESLRQAILNKGVSRDDYPNHPDLTKYPVKYVIVADRMFEETLQPFIAWKTKKGFHVIESYTDEIGTTYAQIQSYLHGLYNSATPTDPAPSFILLVGDVQEVPATQGSSSQRQTDLYHASVDGDYFPEMYYGRMSARNVAQLQAQIDKTLYYEQYQFEDPTYLNKATLIAGDDATWNPKIVQPTIKYATQNYFNTAHGYTDVVDYLTSPYTGSYSPERIAVSFINYSAHCSETEWGTPALTPSAVNNFINANQYPLAVANCCLAGDFGHNECIGETWLRAANKGAICYLGSSPNTYWKEDMYWAVGAFPMAGDNNGYVPTVEETTAGVYDGMFAGDYVATDAMVFLGNLAITEAHTQNYPTHSSVLYYWQAYNCLGDPSLVIYNTEGSENEVSHMAIVPIGMDTYEVNALPGSLVAISKDGILHGSALVDETGVVQVPITPILAGGNVDIVITKPQYIPYMVQIPAAALEGAYIVLENFEINDETGNNNNLADYGETFSVNISMKNVGTDPSSNLTISIEGENEFITLETLNATNFGAINPESTTTVENVATFKVNNYVPDLHKAMFTIVATDGTDTWESNLPIILQAPKLEFSADFTINDIAGNNNGDLDPGETATIGMTLVNEGSSAVSNVFVTLTSTNSLLIIEESAVQIPHIEAGESIEVTFMVTADASITSGETVMLFANTLAGPSGLYKANQSIEFVVGEIPQHNMSSTTITTCSGYFYDSGGPNGDYPSNADLTMTFLPATEDAVVKVSFLEFAVESGYDYLYIYDGLDASATQIGQYSGTTSPGTIIASNTAGALTFRFTSDYSVVEAGWKAEISCHIIGDLDVEATAAPSTICYGGATALKAKAIGGSGTYTYTWTPTETIEVTDAQTTIASPTETTTYTVEVSDGTNTVTSDVTVIVTAEPVIEMNSYDVVLYKDVNSSFELIPTMEDAALYLWSTGETTPTITLHAADYHTGVYLITVMIANSNDCIATANIKLTVQNFVGLEDREELLLYAYPNPARDMINISVIGDSKTFDYELLNYQGQLITTKANNPLNGSAIEQMHVGNLSKGIYYLRVRTGNQLQIQKIVIH